MSYDPSVETIISSPIFIIQGLSECPLGSLEGCYSKIVFRAGRSRTVKLDPIRFSVSRTELSFDHWPHLLARICPLENTSQFPVSLPLVRGRDDSTAVHPRQRVHYRSRHSHLADNTSLRLSNQSKDRLQQPKGHRNAIQ